MKENPASSGQPNAAFDGAASAYDVVFSHSPIGRIQRRFVWDYLEQELEGKSPLNILELNCGTGEDALFLAKMGHQITATDLSPEMVSLTRDKANEAGFGEQVHTRVCGFERVGEEFEGNAFDWIFSDFGGWNCTDANGIRQLGQNLARLQPAGGRLTVVIMARQCLWETAYFGLRLQMGKAFRRWGGGPVTAQLNPGTVKVWYFHPKEIIRLLAPHYQLRALRPIGFCVPPSYLDPFFLRHPGWLGKLEKQDRRLAKRSGLSRFSDHYLVDFTRI
ncbi:MAG: methyltransferase domain-containing protein [Bacteroidia bacterium]|nr:methyltransferase domain-containing protein [Bacteroidia bacterium]